jgi:predicted dehydrogenase
VAQRPGEARWWLRGGFGFHSLDQLRWVCGDVTSVSAALNYNGLTARRGEDAGIITLEHASGAIS